MCRSHPCMCLKAIQCQPFCLTPSPPPGHQQQNARLSGTQREASPSSERDLEVTFSNTPGTMNTSLGWTGTSAKEVGRRKSPGEVSALLPMPLPGGGHEHALGGWSLVVHPEQVSCFASCKDQTLPLRAPGKTGGGLYGLNSANQLLPCKICLLDHHM